METENSGTFETEPETFSFEGELWKLSDTQKITVFQTVFCPKTIQNLN